MYIHYCMPILTVLWSSEFECDLCHVTILGVTVQFMLL